MTTITIETAQATLPDLIEHLAPGESLVITRDAVPVVRLGSELPACRKPRRPGNCIGMLTIVADDDEHLKDFVEYMG